MKIGAVQLFPELGNVQGNIERMNGLVQDVELDLLVLPELVPTGYFFLEKEMLLEIAEEPEGGVFCGRIREVAQEKDMVVIAGFAERAGTSLYNSALIALPNGEWRVYRKAHLFFKEREVFEPGDTGFFVVEWNGIRIGTMICYDWRFPESVRVLALKGADIIAHPSNLVAAKSLWGPTMETRAFENKVVTVTANRWGEDVREGEVLRFSGESQINGMNGKPLAVAPDEGDCVIVAEVDPLRTRSKAFSEYNDILGDRRPEMYDGLCR